MRLLCSPCFPFALESHTVKGARSGACSALDCAACKCFSEKTPAPQQRRKRPGGRNATHAARRRRAAAPRAGGSEGTRQRGGRAQVLPPQTPGGCWGDPNARAARNRPGPQDGAALSARRGSNGRAAGRRESPATTGSRAATQARRTTCDPVPQGEGGRSRRANGRAGRPRPQPREWPMKAPGGSAQAAAQRSRVAARIPKKFRATKREPEQRGRMAAP